MRENPYTPRFLRVRAIPAYFPFLLFSSIWFGASICTRPGQQSLLFFLSTQAPRPFSYFSVSDFLDSSSSETQSRKQREVLALRCETRATSKYSRMLAGDPPAGLLQSLTPSTFSAIPEIPMARSLVAIACILVPSSSLSRCSPLSP